MTVGSNGAINGSQCTTSLDIHFGLVFCSKILLFSLITHFPGTLSMPDHVFHSPVSFFKPHMKHNMVILYLAYFQSPTQPLENVL